MQSIYAYIRVSTKRQSYDRQIAGIKRTFPQYADKAVFIQEKISGRYGAEIRKEWGRLKRIVKENDIILFDSVSRMSRDAEEGVKDYFELYESGVTLLFANEPQINTTVFREVLGKQLKLNAETGSAATDELMMNLEKTLNAFMVALAKEQIKAGFEQAEKEVSDTRKRVRDGMAATGAGEKIAEAKRGRTYMTKKEAEARKIIKEKSIDFNGHNKDIDVMAILAGNGLSLARNTYYKYKRNIAAEATESN